jgi:hypothetical protein
MSTKHTNREKKTQFVSKQFREASYHEGEWLQQVTCSCGFKMPLRFAYKCLYCNEFYCGTCAEMHFGKTRKQYDLEKENLT